MSTPAPAPRARGDGPNKGGAKKSTHACSPRPRGWPLPVAARLPLRHLLPARAGVVPTASAFWARPASAPRRRGPSRALAASVQFVLAVRAGPQRYAADP